MAAAKYPQAFRSNRVSVSVANSNRDGATGTYASGVAGLSTGSEVVRLRINAVGNTDEGAFRIFKWDNTNAPLIFEISVPKRTVAFNVPPWSTVLNFESMGGRVFLPGTTYFLKYNTEKGDSFTVVEELIDY